MSYKALQWAFHEVVGDGVAKSCLVYFAMKAPDEALQERADCSGNVLLVPAQEIYNEGMAPRIDVEPSQIGAAVRHLQRYGFIEVVGTRKGRPLQPQEVQTCKRGHDPMERSVRPNGRTYCRKAAA